MMGNRRLKVMHIITRMVRGGAQLVVLDLLRRLDPERFDPILVSGVQTGVEGSLWGEIAELPIQAIRVPELVRDVAPLRDLAALRTLGRVIAEHRPDVVHSHTSKAGFLGCAAARRQRVPGVVLSPHGHILGAGAQIPGVPYRGIKRRLLAAVARRSSRHAHVVIAPNEAERDEGIGHGMWSAEKSVTVPNGVDTSRYAPGERATARELMERPSDGIIIGTVARLTREKGVDVAIACLPRLPGVELVVVGDGPERDALVGLAEQLGVADRVIFHGSSIRVAELLPAFDAVLVPSRTEAHGMVAAEGLACQVPVVCSDVGGLRSLVLDGETGLRVPPDDPRALARAVRRIIVDTTLAERLARAGRAHVVRSFSLDGMVDSTAAIYEELAGVDTEETAPSLV